MFHFSVFYCLRDGSIEHANYATERGALGAATKAHQTGRAGREVDVAVVARGDDPQNWVRRIGWSGPKRHFGFSAGGVHVIRRSTGERVFTGAIDPRIKWSKAAIDLAGGR